jgi:hypothetical protein
MIESNLVEIFTSRLERANFQYMITGSVACVLYGKPRLTHDIDLVIDLDLKQIPDFVACWKPEQFYCPPEEILKIEACRASHAYCNIIHQETGFKADFYLKGNSPLLAWGLQHRRRFELEKGQYIWVAEPEYVIIKKLDFFREGQSEKHLHDIQGMVDIMQNEIDYKKIEEKCQLLGLQAQWERIKLLPFIDKKSISGA